MAKRKTERHTSVIEEFEYKGVEFVVTADRMRELPPHGYTWYAKVTEVRGFRPKAFEVYGETAKAAIEKAYVRMVAQIEARKT